MKRCLPYARYALTLVVLAFVAGGCGASAAAAYDDPWSGFVVPTFHTFDQEDGLPHDATTAIAQDGDGFLWFGTQDGLARFDGYRFRTYQPSSSDPNALRDGSVTTLHADRAGALWIGTNAGGLARYDSQRDRFVSYGSGGGALSDPHVTAIADDGASGLWIGTAKGLDHLDVASGRIVVARGVEPILSLLRDRTGTLWVGTSDGLAKMPGGASRFARVAFAGRTPGAIACIYEDGPGRLWFGTTARGAFVLGPHDARPHPLLDRTGANVDLPTERISTITTGARGDIWLGTYGHGIVAVDRANGNVGRVAHTSAAESLPPGNVWASFRDRAGGVWLGTLSGVSRLNASDDAIFSLRADVGRRHRSFRKITSSRSLICATVASGPDRLRVASISSISTAVALRTWPRARIRPTRRYRALRFSRSRKRRRVTSMSGPSPACTGSIGRRSASNGCGSQVASRRRSRMRSSSATVAFGSSTPRTACGRSRNGATAAMRDVSIRTL